MVAVPSVQEFFCCSALCLESGYDVSQSGSTVSFQPVQSHVASCDCFGAVGTVDEGGLSGNFGEIEFTAQSIFPVINLEFANGIDDSGEACSTRFFVLNGEVLGQIPSEGVSPIEGAIEFVDSDVGCDSTSVCVSSSPDLCCAAKCAEGGYFVQQRGSFIVLNPQLSSDNCNCFVGTGIISSDGFAANGNFGNFEFDATTSGTLVAVTVSTGIEECGTTYQIVSGEVLGSGAVGLTVSLGLLLLSLKGSWMMMS